MAFGRMSISAENNSGLRVLVASVCLLINSPNRSIDWNFDGNQVIWVTSQNDNALEVTAKLVCNIYLESVPQYDKNFLLAAYYTTDEM